jgi:hypothetical protein
VIWVILDLAHCSIRRNQLRGGNTYRESCTLAMGIDKLGRYKVFLLIKRIKIGHGEGMVGDRVSNWAPYVN